MVAQPVAEPAAPALEERPLNGHPTWPVAPSRSRGRRAKLRRSAQILLAVLLLGAVLTAAALVVRGAFFGGQGGFAAVVQPASVTYLQFPSVGRITQVAVRPGDHVVAGQVLAGQDTTLLQLKLSYDQGSLAADDASVSAIPGTLTAQQHSLSLQVTLAQQELSRAQAQFAAARTTQEQAAANAAITAAQTRIALAENALLTASSGTGSPALNAARAAVARDSAAVASDQVALQEATMTAPSNGVVAYVGGSVGELAGPTGISGGSVPGVPVPTSAGFSLFPPAAQAPSAGSQGGASQPMIAFYPNGPWQAVAMVPQSSIFSVSNGEAAQVALADGGATIPAHVARIDMSPVYENGAASYDVVLALDQSLNWKLMGLAANVTLGSSH